MSLTEDLQKEVEPLWEKMVTHPFVLELGEGTLPWTKFQTYFEQDHLFLRSWVSLPCMGIVKAPDFNVARRISNFMNSVLGGEEALFQRAFQEFGLSGRQVTDLHPLPTTQAFSSYIKNVSTEGTFRDIITAFLAVEWTYLDWSQRLMTAGKRPINAYYREWIDIHAGSELENLVTWMKRMLDDEPAPDKDRLQSIFSNCLRYEVLFWEMSYFGEEWIGDSSV